MSIEFIDKTSAASVAAATAATMAHLPAAEIDTRRTVARTEILQGIAQYPGVNGIRSCVPARLTVDICQQKCLESFLSRCHYPGKLDYFFTQQPFFSAYKFKVRWHCDECHSELDCGTPFLRDN